MGYSVYIRYRGRKYKFPVNPEQVKKSVKLNIEKYQVLKSGQVSIPSYAELAQYTIEDLELPHSSRNYTEPGGRTDPDIYLNMLLRAQKNKTKVQLIYSNGITDDESASVLVESVDIVEKAGEEGDKYVSLTLVQYKKPTKKYMAVSQPVTGPATAIKKEEKPAAENPAVTAGKTYTVQPGDTLWKIAKQFYGDGNMYSKISGANSGQIKNPNVIYAGQTFAIP